MGRGMRGRSWQVCFRNCTGSEQSRRLTGHEEKAGGSSPVVGEAHGPEQCLVCCGAGARQSALCVAHPRV
jgi:hypothetical protein